MRKIILFVTILIFKSLAAPVFAENVSSSELIEQAKSYDNKVVTYQGEVVGSIMQRKDFAWINIHDGKNALGVWLKKELADNIKFSGSYASKGDIVEVQGVFNRACLEHGADMDIHASRLSVITAGEKTIHKLKIKKIQLAGVFLLSTIFLLLLSFRDFIKKKS